MIKDILKDASRTLHSNLEARVLLSHATGYSQEYLLGHSEEELSTKTLNKFYELLERRLAKEPIAYIVGYREFYGRNFILDKNVLIPRCDSEVLVDAVLQNSSLWSLTREPINGKWVLGSSPEDDHKRGPEDDDKRGPEDHDKRRPEGDNFKSRGEFLAILDLGTGSGCLILTLLLEIQNAEGVGVDISNDALAIAQKNIQQYSLESRCKLIQSNWFENITGKYDIIISNPPYISENDTNMMAEETLLYEPNSALFAPHDGYEAYEIIAVNLIKFLKPEGFLFVEIGINQEAQIERIFNKYGFSISKQYKDLSGIVRVLRIEQLL